MKKILISVCFEYSYNQLLASNKDIENIHSISSFSESLLFTDIDFPFSQYTRIIKKPSIEKFVSIIDNYTSIEHVIVFYIAGHGTTSGFLWFNNAILCLSTFFSTLLVDFVSILDMCNAPEIELPYVFCKNNWIFGKGKTNHCIQLVLASSVKGVNSKMNSDGSMYTKTLLSHIQTLTDVKELFIQLQKHYNSSSIYSTTPSFNTLSEFFFILMSK